MFFNVYQVFIFHLKCACSIIQPRTLYPSKVEGKLRQRFWCWAVRSVMLLVQVKQFSKNKFRWNISAQNSLRKLYLFHFNSLFVCILPFFSPWLFPPFRNFKGIGALGKSLKYCTSERKTPLRYLAS